MGQMILFACTCGWSGEALFGPPSAAPTRPHICTKCADIYQSDTCPKHKESLVEWDCKYCPSCSKKVKEQMTTMVD